MPFTRIVLLDFEDSDLALEDWQALGALTQEFSRCRSDDPELAVQLASADGLLVQLGVHVTPALLEAAPRLRYIGVFGTSLGRVDPCAAARGIAVRNVAGFSTHAVAELGIGIALDHLRGISAAARRARRGDLSEAKGLGSELRARRVGVIGLGAIGTRVAEIAKLGFGADVRYWSRTPQPEGTLERLELDALLSYGEILFVHLALTEETRALLDERRIARMRQGALWIHLSPPELLDVPALLRRLSEGSLHFATDHADEMEATDRAALEDAPGCTLYPPIGYATREASAARRAGLLAALRDFLAS